MLHTIHCASEEGGIAANVEEGQEEGRRGIEHNPSKQDTSHSPHAECWTPEWTPECQQRCTTDLRRSVEEQDVLCSSCSLFGPLDFLLLVAPSTLVRVSVWMMHVDLVESLAPALCSSSSTGATTPTKEVQTFHVVKLRSVLRSRASKSLER